MNSIKTLERLQRLHRLIDQEKTGTPKELALRLHLSVRTIHHLIELLKEYDASVSYDRSRKTYFYSDEFTFYVSLSLSINGENQPSQLLHYHSA